MPHRVSTPFCGILLAAALTCSAARGAEANLKTPDGILLKDGRTVRGLIIQNTRDAVVLQEKFDERSYPKKEIVRIYDNPDTGLEYTDVPRRGELPAWRVIANDLRTRDAIQSVVRIPSTVIDVGEFVNVPYMSFRVNDNVELNVYGDPDDPAGVEMGIYGMRSGDDKLRKVLRSYLAGFLTTRDEVRALYSLPFSGGITQAGPITVEITPKNAPDAYGAWWISLFNKNELKKARLSKEEYARLVRPMSEVMDPEGRLIGSGWTSRELANSARVKDDPSRVLRRGFYRDKNGVFRVLEGAN